MTKATTALTRSHAARTQGFVAAVQSLLQAWSARARARRALGRLDAHMLSDIGLDADAAAREVGRPFWEG